MTTPLTRTSIRTLTRTAVNEPTARFITDAEINTWIDEAAKDISIRTFCGTVVATGIATVVNCAEYSWPTAYGPEAATTPIYTLGIKTILNSSKVSLQYIPMDMLGRVGQETYGIEMKWSTWQQTIYLSPVPTAIYTLTPIIWVACHLTAAGTIPRLPEYAQHLVPMYCIAMAREKRRDYETAQLYWQRYESALDRVVQTISHYDTWIDGLRKPRDQAPGG
jgi:hypothetical protein